MNYTDYLKTDYWKAVSDAVKKRAGYRCQLCNSQHDLCAHHRTYEHRGRELEYLDDLTCLCRLWENGKQSDCCDSFACRDKQREFHAKEGAK